MKQIYYDMMEENPVIAAVKDTDGLKECCKLENVRVIFVLFGDICNITEIVKQIKDSDKAAIVHVDLINGLSAKEIVIDYIKNHTAADGIISTKPSMIHRARELELCTVMRFFVLDSMSFNNIEKQLTVAKPDFIEILPGVMPKIIRKVCQIVKQPVVAGGLIMDREDIMAALNAGAISVSSTNQKVWNM